MKKCIYCGRTISEEEVIDFCHKCGIGVFGERMFHTIRERMEKAKDIGDIK